MLVRSGYASLTRLSPPAPADLSVTGLCFQPKALILYVLPGAPGSFGSGGGSRPPAAYFYNSYVGQIGSEFGYRSKWDSGQVSYGIVVGASLGAGDLDATVVSYDPDGFTLHFPFIGPQNFFWTAIGGTNLEAYAGQFLVNAGSTTPIAVTGVGFQPDFLLCTDATDTGVSFAVGHGMASSPSNQASINSSMGVFGSSKHTLLNGYLSCLWETNFAAAKYLAQLASFDVDGFTVDVPSNTGSGNSGVAYLAIKDPDSEFAVGVETQNTSTGTKATTGVGFKPGAGIFLGSYKTVDNDFTQATSPSSDAMMSIGCADGLLNQSCEAEWNISGGFGGHDQNWYADNGIVLTLGDNAATLITAATVDSWDSDGFTLDWTISDAVARYFIYGVMKTLYIDPCNPPSSGFTPIIYRWVTQ